MASAERAGELIPLSLRSPSWSLTPRQLCDLELLLNGGFSPLDGFLARRDYERVCGDMRLADGTLWPIPVTLDVSEETAELLRPGSVLFLRDPQNVPLAALHTEEVWQPDREREAALVYGTTDPKHPAVEHLRLRTHPYYVGGRLEGLQLPVHYDFAQHRFTPAELRRRFASLGWRRIVAFQTRNPMHRVHYELTRAAMRQLGFTLLFTGLPSAGKSTLANVLLVKLQEIGGRPITLLDGHIVRKHLSGELGFSKEHRDINTRRRISSRSSILLYTLLTSEL